MKKCLSILISVLFVAVSWSQTLNYQGKVVDSSGKPLAKVLVSQGYKKVAETDENGTYTIAVATLDTDKRLAFFLENYQLVEVKLSKKRNLETVVLYPLEFNLSEVVIKKQNAKASALRTLKDVEGTTVNAGRKNEVVLLSDMTINKVTNNARQIFSKVVGLTINESSDGGLQLNIGGRGLNPNRTANFNTRQNGYDISADVLGYPESYYTPPAEAVQEIQVIRGASSLQYGTQFGGMVNFKMNQPHIDKWHLNQRISYGSHNLLSSFTSLGGTLGKFSYYGYFNYKQGDGFRPNSEFKSLNGFLNLNYRLDEKNTFHFDWVKYNYLAKQPGGLTNLMFFTDPTQSNRERNWFRVDWNILNLKYTHQFNEDTRFSINAFGLMAERSALGFRSYDVSQPDNPTSVRDLLIGKFKNWGAEVRFVKQYELKDKKNTLLVGAKYYHSKNSSQQGAGSPNKDADFYFFTKGNAKYQKQSKFDYPNLNFAFFAENIFKIGEKTTLTPGFRIEKIKTQSEGYFCYPSMQHGAITIGGKRNYDNVVKDRMVFLTGIAVSHKMKNFELYGNLAQNYRSVTFSDIHSNTPGFAIAPDITDEKGFSCDVGLRGKLTKVLYLDCSIYGLYYGDKIGEYYHQNKSLQVERYRDNVGVALSYGVESLLSWNINDTFFHNDDMVCSTYLNTAFTGSTYLSSDIPNIEGNKVEFVPLVNLKTGLEFGYKNFLFSTQFSYVSEQFAEATNQDTPMTENKHGIFGKIPAYAVWDASLSYKFNNYVKLEGTVQNITNNSYFTQRATGYPGPGIIPSPPLNYVLTLSLSL
ncbi:MAG: TonB-dependent receptor [Flavobacteriaceae bacterium]|nr:TonB-dependent receptor [Flavobacteriaceae bacterium]